MFCGHGILASRSTPLTAGESTDDTTAVATAADSTAECRARSGFGLDVSCRSSALSRTSAVDVVLLKTPHSTNNILSFSPVRVGVSYVNVDVLYIHVHVYSIDVRANFQMHVVKAL